MQREALKATSYSVSKYEYKFYTTFLVEYNILEFYLRRSLRSVTRLTIMGLTVCSLYVFDIVRKKTLQFRFLKVK